MNKGHLSLCIRDTFLCPILIICRNKKSLLVVTNSGVSLYNEKGFVGNICYSPLVIDALDSMKKGRGNYAAREAIKFLERNLQGGGKMMRVQGPEETLQSPGTRKPPKMDLNTWSAMPCIF